MNQNEDLEQNKKSEDWVDRTIKRFDDIQRLLHGLEPITTRILVTILSIIGLLVIVAKLLSEKLGV